MWIFQCNALSSNDITERLPQVEQITRCLTCKEKNN